jgi:hypothetical protein
MSGPGSGDGGRGTANAAVPGSGAATPPTRKARLATANDPDDVAPRPGEVPLSRGTGKGPGEGAAPPTGRLTLADARARYREVYERLREKTRLAAARLQQGDMIAIDADTLTFGLPHAIQVSALAPSTVAFELLTNVVKEVFGRAYAVHCVHTPDVEDRLRAQPAKPSHLLDEALKLGARPLDS